jgi:hypothetical protein
MQITIDLPNKLAEKIQGEWGNLSQKIIASLALDAFLEGLINFDDLKEMLNLSSNDELKEFFKQKNMLHSGGLLNLAGACPELELVVDELGISDDMDDDLIVVFDDFQSLEELRQEVEQAELMLNQQIS